ncbi:MAG: ATP-binding cassette domain-containing protein [Flavobacteriales bacterium]
MSFADHRINHGSSDLYPSPALTHETHPPRRRNKHGHFRAPHHQTVRLPKALNDISFEIGGSEVVGFLGPNGAGKSTMMKILTCFLPPTSGDAKASLPAPFANMDE